MTGMVVMRLAPAMTNVAMLLYRNSLSSVMTAMWTSVEPAMRIVRMLERPFFCGDGAHCPEFEFCDDGFLDACGTCNVDCTASGDGATCGDSVICPETELCDDGYADDCGSCNSTCTELGTGAACGDGEFCEEVEFCDDGYTDMCGYL